jgi:hypothetical protein
LSQESAGNELNVCAELQHLFLDRNKVQIPRDLSYVTVIVSVSLVLREWDSYRVVLTAGDLSEPELLDAAEPYARHN